MKRMRLLPIFLLPFAAISQNTDRLKNKIDSTVEAISNDSSMVTAIFKTKALKKTLHYKYQTSSGNIVKIERQVYNKVDTIEQVFYLQKGLLLYATESIAHHYGNDTITWAGNFYFKNGKLVHYSTLGHGKSETDNWEPEVEMLSAFNEAKYNIAKHRSIKKIKLTSLKYLTRHKRLSPAR